ncbi:RNA methyltransferase [Sphingomonas bacterium]|uniref:TrmH family RNA methyltransferase n=1 Tax=Sphingomonas bacterium TaxID=1895847 RepID=UPI0020C5D75A|nr:RNA methyltransferase [Sphingomonas bacterium]
MILGVADPDDPRIAAYRDIRERDLVGRQGLFVAEGRVVLAMLLASTRFAARSVLIAAHRVAALADLIAQVPDDVPVYAADQRVLDAIAGFPLHRGILAIGERREPLSADALLASLPERATVVALSGIANHDNMGGIFRNAAAFGADAVVMDGDCCDPLYRKAIRVSVGAVLSVPFAVASVGEDLVGLLQAQGFDVLALGLTGERTLAEVVPGPRIAALFGAEGPGLPAAMLARANGVRIPMAGGFDSLNVATTSGIVLHHLMNSDRR